jgi:hypothetical protein
MTWTHNLDTGAYDFETDAIQGSIQPNGAYHGVTRLIDRRTGRQVIHPKYSALNLFRLFSVNQGMGQPRSMERAIDATAGAVEIRWPATEAHQGELLARYEVREPNAVDLTVTVRSQGTYAGYELFLSSYFDPVLCPHVILKANRYGAAPPLRRCAPVPERIVPMVNDVFRGTVLVFPRDAHAARRCLDGRWERSEWASPTVQMCPVRHYAYPVAFLTDPERQLGTVLTSSPRDCYAISTRYHAENEADRMTPYSAFDLSLFGDDLLPGDERSARVRLALTSLDEEMSQPLALCQAFATNPPGVNRR